MSTYNKLGGKTLAELPQIPTKLNVIDGQDSLTMNWQNNNTVDFNTSNQVIQYWKNSNGIWINDVVLPYDATTATTTGISEGGSYNIRVATLYDNKYYPSIPESGELSNPPWFPVEDLNIVNHDYESSPAEYDLSTIPESGETTGPDPSCITHEIIDKRMWFTFKATTNKVDILVKSFDEIYGDCKYKNIGFHDSEQNELGCETYSSDISDVQLQYTGLTIGDWYYIQIFTVVNSGYLGSFTIYISDNY